MKRFFGVILLVFSISCAASPQRRDTVSVAAPPIPQKSPVVAVALSMLMPGAGQLYDGEPGKAALHFGLFAGSVGWVWARNIGPTNADIKPLDWVSVATVGVTYLWAAIDAGVSARGGPESPAEPPHLSVGTFRSRVCTGISLSYAF